MKNKFLLLTLLLLTTIFSVYGFNDKVVCREHLPLKAKTFIDTYFQHEIIQLIYEDKDFSHTTYDVYLTNNIQIEFNKKGQWIKLNYGRNSVPSKFIPLRIYNVAQETFPNERIIQIERSRNGFVIRLINGVELKFDSYYRLIGVDD